MSIFKEQSDNIVSKLSELPVPAALIGAAGAGLLYKKYRDKKKFDNKWGLNKQKSKDTLVRDQIDDIFASNVKQREVK